MRIEPLPTSGIPNDPRTLSDDDLLRRLGDLLGQARRVESELVAHIAAADRRGLYAQAAADSMFTYCTDVLHLSEHEAYLRIAVARASREHPVLLEMLADGRLHLSGVAKLAPHLTHANRDSVLSRAVHRTKEQILELVVELAPRPDAPQVIRRLPGAPTPTTGAGPTEPPTPVASELGLDRVVARPSVPPRVVPLAPARYLFQFTASGRFQEKRQRLKALMRTTVPDEDLAVVLEQAVTEKLERMEARRFGRTRKPKKALPLSPPVGLKAHSLRSSCARLEEISPS